MVQRFAPPGYQPRLRHRSLHRRARAPCPQSHRHAPRGGARPPPPPP
ncbi:hypothetical protein ACP70R_040679 [Stipagrostis hirtigluma subsp. patula]